MKYKKILLVDDDPDDQVIFMDVLDEITTNTECITAKNGLEALDYLKKTEPVPSFIFLDLNMPLMNGIECLSKIKSDKRLNKIPVIIFTTSDNPSDEKISKELGAAVFFTKTANFKSLKAQLHKILETDFLK